MFRKLKSFCILVGAYELGKFGWSAAEGFHSYFLKAEENLKERYGGGYAIITGSTSGIGKEFAKSLAKRGFNLILISRDEKKLKNDQEEFTKSYEGIDVRTIAYNFSNESPEDFEKLVLNKLNGLDISILVNNVGIAQNPGKFEHLSAEKIKELVNVNMISQCYLSNYFLSHVKNRSNLTAMINMSSAVSLCPDPFSCVYAATKTFNRYLSESLWEKISSDVTAVAPGMVETQMSKGFIGNYSVMGIEMVKAKSLAENVVRSMDNDQNMAGTPVHGIFNYFQSKFPSLFSKFLFLFQLNIMSLAKN